MQKKSFSRIPDLSYQITHLAERPTGRPGAMLTWVRVPVLQGIFVPESAFSVDGVACINICAHVTAKHWQLYHCFVTRKHCRHWLVWVALLLRLLCLTQVARLWWPEFPARDSEVRQPVSQKFPQRCVPQERSSNTSSFHASLLQAIDGVKSLAAL